MVLVRAKGHRSGGRYRQHAGPKPWSKLQRELYKLLLPELDLQIHCQTYRMDSQRGNTDLPRYWISLGEKIIWDYPGDFAEDCGPPYPYKTDISAISALLREYIDTPRYLLCVKDFAVDRWGLTYILKAADRRLGRKKLRELRSVTKSDAALKVLTRRERLRVKSTKNSMDEDTFWELMRYVDSDDDELI